MRACSFVRVLVLTALLLLVAARFASAVSDLTTALPKAPDGYELIGPLDANPITPKPEFLPLSTNTFMRHNCSSIPLRSYIISCFRFPFPGNRTHTPNPVKKKDCDNTPPGWPACEAALKHALSLRRPTREEAAGSFADTEMHYVPLVGSQSLSTPASKFSQRRQRKQALSPAFIELGVFSNSRHSASLHHEHRPWPRRTIPFCFNDSVNDGILATFSLAFAFMNEYAGLNFVLVSCDAPGHKIMVEQSDRSLAFVGCVHPNSLNHLLHRYIPNDGNLFPGPSTSQFIRFNPLHGTPEAIHEIMHTLGFHHQHQVGQRDNFVTVNRLPENSQLYDRCHLNVYRRFPGPQRNPYLYDYNSIMHYPQRSACAVGLLPAGTPLFTSFAPLEQTPERQYVGNPADIGPRYFPSEEDLENVKDLFRERPH